MGIAASELCRYVIRPTLIYLGRHSQTAETLLLGVAASQSELGSALHDRRGHGLYRITETRHRAQRAAAGADRQLALRHRHRLVTGGTTSSSIASIRRFAGHGPNLERNISPSGPAARLHPGLANLCIPHESGRLLIGHFARFGKSRRFWSDCPTKPLYLLHYSL